MKNKFVHNGDLPSDFRVGTAIAIDTETMGLVSHRDRLCLLQLSSGDGNAHMIQFKNGLYDAPNLKAILNNPEIIKIFHFARFDIATIYKYLGVSIKNCYCTKIASKLIRTYTNYHGLKELCSELLGVRISKQQQSSDWGKEILTNEQIEYAASDVLFLHRLREILNQMLKREDRMHLAEECFNFLETRVMLDLQGWSDIDIFAHQ